MVAVNEFNKYQQLAHNGRYIPLRWGWLIASLACALKQEVADKIAKYYRGDGDLDVEGLQKELGDVLWFIAELSTHLDIELEDVAQMNINKLQERMRNNTIKGSGDNR